MLERLCVEQRIEWEMKGATVIVDMASYRRQQRIQISREGSQYVFSTLVLDATAMHRKPSYRHRVALRAWPEMQRRNWLPSPLTVPVGWWARFATPLITWTRSNLRSTCACWPPRVIDSSTC